MQNTTFKGNGLKKHSVTGKNKFCRFILKFGSGLFLLFFTLFSAATPLIAQLGSAIFLLLVMCLAPLAPEVQSDNGSTPEQSEAVYSQIDENTPCCEIVFSRNLRQQHIKQISSADSERLPEKKLLFQIKSPQTAYNEQKVKPEEWRKRCQPVRAGPMVSYI